MACMISVVGTSKHLVRIRKAGLSHPEGTGMVLSQVNHLTSKFIQYYVFNI